MGAESFFSVIGSGVGQFPIDLAKLFVDLSHAWVLSSGFRHRCFLKEWPEDAPIPKCLLCILICPEIRAITTISPDGTVTFLCPDVFHGPDFFRGILVHTADKMTVELGKEIKIHGS